MRGAEVRLRMSDELLARIDEAAKAALTTRSSYIRDCVARQLNNQRVVIEPSEEDFYKYLEQQAAKEEAKYAASHKDEDNLFDL